MLRWIKSLFSDEITLEALERANDFHQAFYGRKFFTADPWSDNVRKHGVKTRLFRDTRHDN